MALVLSSSCHCHSHCQRCSGEPGALQMISEHAFSVAPLPPNHSHPHHRLDESTRTQSIRINIDNADEDLHPGQFVDVALNEHSTKILASCANAFGGSHMFTWASNTINPHISKNLRNAAMSELWCSRLAQIGPHNCCFWQMVHGRI